MPTFLQGHEGVTRVLQSSSIHSPSLQLSFRFATTFREGANLQYQNVNLIFDTIQVSCISFTSPINLFFYLNLVPVDWKSTTFSKGATPSERRGEKNQPNKKNPKLQTGFEYTSC